MRPWVTPEGMLFWVPQRPQSRFASRIILGNIKCSDDRMLLVELRVRLMNWLRLALGFSSACFSPFFFLKEVKSRQSLGAPSICSLQMIAMKSSCWLKGRRKRLKAMYCYATNCWLMIHWLENLTKRWRSWTLNSHLEGMYRMRMEKDVLEGFWGYRATLTTFLNALAVFVLFL
jgi:hypothetical protein